MRVRSVIRQRLAELGLEQRDLAVAAKVTESYISQLLTRKKPPPAPNRTDIYPKMEKVLRLSAGRLSELADLERTAELKKQLQPSAPLLRELRDLALRKCAPASKPEVQAIFEKDRFGEFEYFVTQKLLDVSKRVVREELENEGWLRLVGRLSRRPYEELRVVGLEFLDTDVFNVSADDCTAFLDPLLESWEIDVRSFAMTIQLNRRLVLDYVRKFEFTEQALLPSPDAMDGFKEFLADETMRATATAEEIEYLRGLRFKGKFPTALFYYRELQNLRDPLHFQNARKTAPRSPRNFGTGS